jgi:hypothetical protein
MSFVVSSLTDYVDQSSTDLLLPAVSQGKTATIVNLQAGVKSSAALQLFDSTVVFQDDSCAFNGSASTTFSQREIVVEGVKVQEVLCPKDLEAKWTQLLLSAGSDYTEADIPAAYMDIKMQRLQDALEIADWQGEDGGAGGANLDKYDGFLHIIDTAAASVDGNVDAVTVATGITSANALNIVQGIYSVVPEAVLNADDLVCFMGWDAYRALIINITDTNFYHYVTDDSARTGELMLPGTNLKVVAVNGLTGTNRIITSRASNMYIGMDAMSDSDSIKMWESMDDQNVKSSINFKRGTQVAYPAEIVEFTLVP